MRGDPRTRLAAALDQVELQVAAMTPEDLGQPTPCVEYDVRTLVAHLVAVLRKLGVVGNGGAMTEVPDPAEDVTGGPVAAFRQARADLERVWAPRSTLDAEYALAWGTMSGHELLDAYAPEFTVHAWDLSRATGRGAELDPALAEAALDWYSRYVPAADRREGGPFGPLSRSTTRPTRTRDSPASSVDRPEPRRAERRRWASAPRRQDRPHAPRRRPPLQQLHPDPYSGAMNLVVQLFAVLAALFHVGAFVLESFLFHRPSVQTFLLGRPEPASGVRLWAFNQGFYNLFVAAGLAVGLIALHTGHVEAGRALVLYCCAFMAACGLVLLVSDRRLWRSTIGQSGPPLVALVAALA